MPYNPGISYRGDQYIAQGISSLGQNVGQSIFKVKEELDKAKEDKAADDIIFGLAQQSEMLNPEEQARYLSGDTKERNGIIAGTLRKFALNFQQQQLESLQEQRKANADYRRMQMLAFPLQQQGLRDQHEAAAQLSRERAAALNFKPGGAVTVPVLPPGQTGIPFGPPTEAEAAAQAQPGIQMFEESAGKWTPLNQALKPTDKTVVTLPDGRQVYVTGNEAARLQQPPKTKDIYGVSQSIFTDPTKTKRGNVVVKDGQTSFQPADEGTHVRLNIHKDKTSGVEVDSGIIPVEEYNTHLSKLGRKPLGAPSATPTAAPAGGPAKAGYQEGQTVTLKNGKTVTITKVNPDGTFEVR